jgi:Fic family protein
MALTRNVEGSSVRTVYFDIDDKTDELRGQILKSRAKAQIFFERFEVSWIYHENAQEGLVLDLFDLKAALDHSALEDGVLIPTYQRIRNIKNAIDKVKKAVAANRTPNLQFIKGLHIILSNGIAGQAGGVYRHEIPIHRNYFHDIIQPSRISAAMTNFVRQLQSKEFRQFHPFKQAAEAHYRLMAAFPFNDDNGKVARLLMNFYTMRNNYFPVIIPDVERQRYYESLRGSSDVLHSLIVECMERELDLALKFFTEGGKGVF